MAEAFDSGMETSDMELSDVEAILEAPAIKEGQDGSPEEGMDQKEPKPSASGRGQGPDKLANISPIRTPSPGDKAEAGPSNPGPARPVLKRIEFVPPLESSGSSGSEQEWDNAEYRVIPTM
jgi:hypothetical protein